MKGVLLAASGWSYDSSTTENDPYEFHLVQVHWHRQIHVHRMVVSVCQCLVMQLNNIKDLSKKVSISSWCKW